MKYLVILLPLLLSAQQPTCQIIESKFLQNLQTAIHPTEDKADCKSLKRAIVYAELLNNSGCTITYPLDEFLESAKPLYNTECK